MGPAPIIPIRMLIGLISDTHIREAATTMPPEIELAFRDVDLILHGGDIYTSAVLDQLERIAPVLAVSGDDDYGEVLQDKRVKQSQILYLEGHKLWLVHENPYAHSLNPRSGGNSAVKSDPDAPDIVVFGHIHYTVVKQYNGVLLVNPGSPFNYSRKLGTVATLRLEPGKSNVNVLSLEEFGC
jgi:putative phosphoesterase